MDSNQISMLHKLIPFVVMSQPNHSNLYLFVDNTIEYIQKYIYIYIYIYIYNLSNKVDRCNSPSPLHPLLADMSVLAFLFPASPRGFKTCLLGRSFLTLIKNASWGLIIHLPSRPASSLALVLLSNRCGISQ